MVLVAKASDCRYCGKANPDAAECCAQCGSLIGVLQVAPITSVPIPIDPGEPTPEPLPTALAVLQSSWALVLVVAVMMAALALIGFNQLHRGSSSVGLALLGSAGLLLILGCGLISARRTRARKTTQSTNEEASRNYRQRLRATNEDYERRILAAQFEYRRRCEHRLAEIEDARLAKVRGATG